MAGHPHERRLSRIRAQPCKRYSIPGTYVSCWRGQPRQNCRDGRRLVAGAGESARGLDDEFSTAWRRWTVDEGAEATQVHADAITELQGLRSTRPRSGLTTNRTTTPRHRR
jgi:hypothetical protein